MNIKSDIKSIGTSLYELLIQPFITLATWLLFKGGYATSIIWLAIMIGLLNYMFN